MSRKFVMAYQLGMFCAAAMAGSAAVASDELLVKSSKPIPITRPETKRALEKLKHRQPRLPLPPVSAAERERAEAGRLGLVNNGRMRALYLPELVRGSGFSRQRDPNMPLDPVFMVELFWIASRVNNCHYCLGHQEVKLRSAGVAEDRVAALDCDWTRFTAAERAAYSFARKLTLEPHQISDEDLADLGKHYEPLAALQIAFSVARYNAINRWTDSLGIPQEANRDLLTDTSAEFYSLPSIVVSGAIPSRGPLPPRDEVLQQWAKCRHRQARLPVASEIQAREVIAGESHPELFPQWIRLLAQFPVAGKSAIEDYRRAENAGRLSAELKAQIAWTAARHDRAWYALGRAAKRLKALGYDQDQTFALDQLGRETPESQRAALTLVAKLTATPQAITDSDVVRLRQHFDDRQVAEIVFHTTQAAFFNRLTEAAGLPIEAD